MSATPILGYKIYSKERANGIYPKLYLDYTDDAVYKIMDVDELNASTYPDIIELRVTPQEFPCIVYVPQLGYILKYIDDNFTTPVVVKNYLLDGHFITDGDYPYHNFVADAGPISDKIEYSDI